MPESEGPDDPNGVATLTVLRSRSTVGEVTVYWEVAQDGVMDLQPTSGSLTFREVSTPHIHFPHRTSSVCIMLIILG